MRRDRGSGIGDRGGMRAGSALIIVLGMLSFMVVSAVGFSVYMRASRQPSSYLRRASTTRSLLKSALANAIERLDGRYATLHQIHSLTKSVDPDFTESAEQLQYGNQNPGEQSGGYMEGICDDPYPGVGPRLKDQNGNQTASAQQEADSATAAMKQNGGYFTHRVFTPFGPVDRSQTVATLTLEGLAYLPPALINEVRVYSRYTRTACWRNLSYEAGRYAFCAIDVSDLFDINKVDAEPRSSAANSRIGFSSLFLTGSNWSDVDTSEDTGHPFGKIVATLESQQIPSFLSLADFNLLAYKVDSGESTTFAPFCHYVAAAGNVPQIQKSEINNRYAPNALFVTDTWFPPTNNVPPRFNLSAGGQSQPFDEFNRNFGAEDVLRAARNTQLGQKILDQLGGTGTVCLYDYLDRDNIPTSYALPTVETAPMVCALGLKSNGAGGGLKPSVVVGADVRQATISLPAKKQEIVVTATPYEFDWGVEKLHVTGLAAFPFKRTKDKKYTTSFKVDGLVRIFLAPTDLNCHLDAGSPLYPKAADDWKDDYANGIITRKVSMVGGNLSFTEDLPEQKDAVKSFEGDAELDVERRVVFWEVKKQTFTVDPEQGTRIPGPEETYYSMDGVTLATNPIETYDKTGKKENWLNTLRSAAKPAMFENGAKIGEGDLPTKVADAGKNLHDGNYVPHVALWVKVSNSGGNDSGKVVDIVPACGLDDKTWGQHNESENDEVRTACSTERPPVMRFSCKSPFPYGIGAIDALQSCDGAFDVSAVFAIDPRYNYAPEAWYAPGGVDPSELGNGSEKWLTAISGLLGDQHNRDHDIFMFTGDQEYLQSMGELQFLPVTRDLYRTPGNIIENFVKWDDAWRFNSRDGAVNFVESRGEARVWTTYSAFAGDPVYNLGDPKLTIVSSQNDYRVNPFSSDKRVLMAAFANTPYDYAVASTNPACNVAKDEFPSYDFMLRHAFNSKTACAKMTDGVNNNSSEIEQIAENFREELRACVKDDWNGDTKTWPDWESVYDDLAWEGMFNGNGNATYNVNALFGVTLNKPLHDVDRKFLYSFWRECFQNRQQLFLVFIRAEPLSGGGGGKEALSCTQLGVHGVALVWRDPKPPTNWSGNRLSSSAYDGDIPPHRTRVLFYHQFD